MRSLPVLVVLLASVACGFSKGWVGQQMVNHPNGDTYDGQPCIAVDGSGRPWMAWGRGGHPLDSSLMYTRWLGDRWDTERSVGPNLPGVKLCCKPRMCFDGQGRAWLVWHNVDTFRDISFRRWADTGWSPEMQVNVPDSSELDFAPRVACGGGQVWCVWYGGPNDASPYSVFASRWDSSAGAWEPETQVSPPDGNHHWWCDVAVDPDGVPHVVWCTHPLYTVFHSYYDGDRWSDPEPVNDTTAVTASPWADPHIVIDRTGMMHLCFTGAVVGTLHRDILYTTNDGSGWQPCQIVSQDSIYDEWYSDIAADRPDNVWVVWDRQNEGPDQFRVYACHYDGVIWSQEERLDNDSAYYDISTDLTLDSSGSPWVTWSGMLYGGSNADVFYNRRVDVSLADKNQRQGGRPGLSLTVVNPVLRAARFSFELGSAASVSLEVFDEAGRCVWLPPSRHLSAGHHVVEWDACPNGVRAAAGVYYCSLSTSEARTVCKFVIMPL